MDLLREPRGHGDPVVLKSQRSRLADDHVAPLNDLATQIAVSVGQSVPKFDPSGAGTRAAALILLESPGPASTDHQGSGIISPHNDDPTAARVHALLTGHRIPFDKVTFWNVVPWWLPSVGSSAGSFRAPRNSDIDAAAPWLEGLLALLPHLRIVMTLGRAAQRGLARYARHHQLPYVTIAGPHPGPRVWNEPRLRSAIDGAFGALAELLSDSNDPTPRHLDYWPSD